MAEQYIKTADIKTAVDGREEDVIDLIVPGWRQGSPHVRCPYPDHGGDDDWRWDKSKRHAICTCTGKHADSVFDVVQKCEGLDFDGAKLRVAEILGREDLIKEKATPADGSRRFQKTDAASLLTPPADNRDDGLVRRYLAHRLKVEPDQVIMPLSRVAGHMELAYFDPPASQRGKPIVVASPPCAVFETRDVAGKRHAHRIYLAPNGAGKADLGKDKRGKDRDPKKSAKLADKNENTAGRSVFWGDPRETSWIVVGEGVETCAAIALAFRAEIAAGEMSVAAAISTSGLMAFLPWPKTTRITVAADRDEAPKPDRPNAERKAGEIAARAFCLKNYKQYETAISLPGSVGEDVDWLNVLEHQGAEAVRAGILAASAFLPTLDEEGEQQEHDNQAAEIAEIAATYPLPELNLTVLAYMHTSNGRVFIHKVVPPTKAGDVESYVPIASPFGVVARLRRIDQANAYGMRAVVEDMEGNQRHVEFARSDLAKQGGSEVRGALLANGLRTEGDGDAVVMQCLKAAHPAQEIVVLAKPSWHEVSADKPPIFISPGGEVIGPTDGTVYELDASARMAIENAIGGTFEGWKAAVGEATRTIGCEHWTFALMAGFAGTLISLTGLDTCGVSLSGQSSGGKSTAQRMAASVWSTPDIRKPGLCQSARSTDNALEAAAARSNGTVLVLDELAHVDGKVVGKIIYMLAGGTGKARMKADASIRANHRWSTFVLLSGECSLEEKVTSAGGEWMAGMAVRIPDLDITGVNRQVDPAVMRRIEQIDEHYGHAGPAFIHALTAADIHRRPVALREAIKVSADELAGPGADPMVRRAAEPFAAVSIAGSIAQDAGIIPADINIPHVIGWAWSRFRNSSNAIILSPEEQVVFRIRTWILERWNVTIRFVDAEAGNREVVGWFDADAVYIPKDRLREAAGEGMKEIAVAKILSDLKYLKKRKDVEHYTVNFVPKIGKTVAYALDRDAFGRDASETDRSAARGWNVVKGGLADEG